MIDFSPQRLRRVRTFLRQFDRENDAERVYRVLSQSYKVASCASDVAGCVGAIGYLLTGEPENFEQLGCDSALTLATELFAAPNIDGTGGLLLQHATAVLSVKAVRGARYLGYLNFEKDHLVLLGGRTLFLETLRALASRYVDEPEGVRTYAQAAAADAAFWMRHEVVQRAIEGRRCWGEWSGVVARAAFARRTRKGVTAAPGDEGSTKLYLDDQRPAPKGWKLVQTAPEAIDLLAAGGWTHLSLDHDLGDDAQVGTGYDVLLWIEDSVALRDFVPPEIEIHSANVSARQRMLLAVESIERLLREREKNPK